MREIPSESGLPFNQLTSWTSLDPKLLYWKTPQTMILSLTDFYEDLVKSFQWNVTT